VTRDPVEAVRLFQLAADQGEASAQISLGSCYLKGDGVPLSFQACCLWLDAVVRNPEATPAQKEFVKSLLEQVKVYR
jgi:TPR repeat protein